MVGELHTVKEFEQASGNATFHRRTRAQDGMILQQVRAEGLECCRVELVVNPEPDEKATVIRTMLHDLIGDYLSVH